MAFQEGWEAPGVARVTSCAPWVWGGQAGRLQLVLRGRGCLRHWHRVVLCGEHEEEVVQIWVALVAFLRQERRVAKALNAPHLVEGRVGWAWREEGASLFLAAGAWTVGEACGAPPSQPGQEASASQGPALALWEDGHLHPSVQNGTSGQQFFRKIFFSAWDLIHQETQTGPSANNYLPQDSYPPEVGAEDATTSVVMVAVSGLHRAAAPPPLQRFLV